MTVQLRNIVVAVVALAAMAVQALPLYKVTDITLQPSSQGRAVNSLGQVAGSDWYQVAPYNRAWLYRPGIGTQDLGALGGAGAEALGINDAGQVVGWAHNAQGMRRAFLYTTATGMLDLGTLGGASSLAYDINQHGHIVGAADTASGAERAFFYTPLGGMQDLGSLGGNSGAVGISDVGHVSGYSRNASGESRAFLYTPSDGMVDLNVPSPFGGFAFATGQDVNNKGHVVGITGSIDSDFFGFRAFLYTNEGGVQDIGHLPAGFYDTVAMAINDDGRVVGNSANSAFIYTSQQGIVNLNTLLDPQSGQGWHLEIANDISANGYITGYGMFNGEFRAFLLTPVPEPGTWALMGIGLLGVAGSVRSGRRERASV